MNYVYAAVTDKGEKREGMIEAVNQDLAISGLQRRGLIVTSIKSEEAAKKWYEITLFERVQLKDVVNLTSKMST